MGSGKEGRRLSDNGYLLDTHALIWVAGEPEKLSDNVIDILSEESHRFYFSAVSIQEIAIKTALNHPLFNIDASALAEGLVKAGFSELSMTAEHACGLANLPEMHKDPFDRMLVSQAKVERLNLITNDGKIMKYCADFISLTECC